MSARPELSDEPPAKRQKLQTEIQRSPDFWFKEGRFVFVANQKMAYRLHGDVLGRKSKVFSDLLNLSELPRPDPEDTIDGCPVVHITESPEDFSTFLSLIYDCFEHLRQHVQEPRWATVRIMMIFGDKYDVPEMRAEGIRQLGAWYAEDIDEWDNRDEKFFAQKTDHLSVASLTRALAEPGLHEAVLYHCCRLPISKLVAGDPATGCPPLCTDDLVRTLVYLKGMCSGYLGISSDVFGYKLWKKLLRCAECRLVWDTLLKTVDIWVKDRIDRDAYSLLDGSIWKQLSSTVGDILCNECQVHYRQRLQLVRQAYREDLVDIFDCAVLACE